MTNDMIIIYIAILLLSPFLGAFIGQLFSKKHRGIAMMFGAMISTSVVTFGLPMYWIVTM
ncbi:hypothetical protein FKN04_12970 [Bacillus glycinifermentans]|uniref:hypothetical protein n=1 Tax=Bacillus glycinifermentans TaxID=1664069 RepID=UPI001582C67B|nr:hypothetical protein [Bacillus glycinifermentans]NUJ17488.1 hypothetical protein [Bacillus glycinifermentans]